MNDIYYIVPFAEITQWMIDAMIQDSLDTIRRSVDGVYAVLKTNGYNSAFDGYESYTHSEMIPIMQTPEWQEELI